MNSQKLGYTANKYLRRGQTYLESPDMVAFTIGRVVMGKMIAGRPLSWDTLRARLEAIAQGDEVDADAGVHPDMAIAALQYMPSSRSANFGKD